MKMNVAHSHCQWCSNKYLIQKDNHKLHTNVLNYSREFRSLEGCGRSFDRPLSSVSRETVYAIELHIVTNPFPFSPMDDRPEPSFDYTITTLLKHTASYPSLFGVTYDSFFWEAHIPVVVHSCPNDKTGHCGQSFNRSWSFVWADRQCMHLNFTLSLLTYFYSCLWISISPSLHCT